MREGAADYLLKDRLPRLGEAVRHALSERQIRFEKQLAERELRVMDWAIHSSINAVAMADLEGQINFVNQAFLDLWGYDSYGQIHGGSLFMLWEKEDEAHHIQKTLHKRQNLQSEMLAKKRNNTSMALQFSVSTVLDEHRQPICIMAMFIDITEAKKVAAAQREAEILRIQLEKEKELRDLKSRFMSMVVHDFRNPLAVMQLQLDALIHYADRLDQSTKEDRLNLALNQIQHLNNLMNDVLAIGQLESNDARFHPKAHDLIPFCKQAVDVFRESIGTNHIIQYETASTALSLPFDRQLLRRAVTNLLSNAVKYSPDGSTVHVTLKNTPDYVTIAVTDKGIGIPDDDQKRLFDAFHRAGNVGAVAGTGLGLAIVKQVVELHGGTISFSSEVGKGSTFTIKIPVSS
ncbi:MAG: PAS domain-containing sensor histidine kinase [Anaerolineae bacterium]|nr:PAS domain-containing sensor histidine kinase [Anaerolineae bacterium]